MLHTAEQAEGTADELRRIEQEFQRQRDQLASGTEQFDDWMTAWRGRQAEIDASLARLRQTLAASGEGMVEADVRPITIFFTAR